MMAKKRIRILVVLFLAFAPHVCAQEYHGITGLIQAPSAEIDSAGTFRGNISWVDKAMLPNLTYYSDGIPFSAPCYTIGLSVFKWLQLSYTGTIVKIHPNDKKSEPLGYYNEDRHINLKLIPLYEGKWWPSVSLGWDDIGYLSVFKLTKSWTTNSFFGNLYIAVSKHIDIKGYELGAHISYRYYTYEKNKNRRGFAGGLTFVPRLGKSLQGPRAWLQRPRVIVEWDGVGVNVGADVLLWRHLFVQASLIHGTGFSATIGYHYAIRF